MNCTINNCFNAFLRCKSLSFLLLRFFFVFCFHFDLSFSIIASWLFGYGNSRIYDWGQFYFIFSFVHSYEHSVFLPFFSSEHLNLCGSNVPRFCYYYYYKWDFVWSCGCEAINACWAYAEVTQIEQWKELNKRRKYCEQFVLQREWLVPTVEMSLKNRYLNQQTITLGNQNNGRTVLAHLSGDWTKREWKRMKEPSAIRAHANRSVMLCSKRALKNNQNETENHRRARLKNNIPCGLFSYFLLCVLLSCLLLCFVFSAIFSPLFEIVIS